MSRLEDGPTTEYTGTEPSLEDMYSPGASFSKSAYQTIQGMFEEALKEAVKEVERLYEKYSPAILASLDREKKLSFSEIYSKVAAPDKVDTYLFKSVLNHMRDNGLVLFSSDYRNFAGDVYWLPSCTKEAPRNMIKPPSQI